MERRAAFDARLPTAAVGDEFVLVPAGVALGVDVVPQGRAAVLHADPQDVDDRRGEPVGAGPADSFRLRVDPREEERLIGIDVADARHRPLGEELRLHGSLASSQSFVEDLAGERWVERFRTHLPEGRDVVVLAGRHDPEAPEPTDVAKHEVGAVVESPHGAGPGIVRGALWVGGRRLADEERAGHSQVRNELLGPVVEVDHEVLAPSANVGHGCADRVERRRKLGARVCVAGHEGAADQLGRELSANRLDLGQLWHAATVASRFVDRMLARFVEELLETANVPETLDEAAQAEAWASGAVAEWVELGGDAGELADQIEAAAPLPAALVRWLVDGEPPTVGPDWIADLGGQRPTDAWMLRAAGASGDEAEAAVIVEFEAPSKDRHAVSITIADGRAVDCGVGPAGLAEAADEHDADAMDVTPLAVDEALERLRAALGSMRSDELTVNGRLNVPLALRRFGVAPDTAMASTGTHPAVPIPPRDPEDDTWAADLLRSALRLHEATANLADAPASATEAHAAFSAALDAGDADAQTVVDVCGLAGADAAAGDGGTYLRAIAAYLRPVDLSVHPTPTQEALIELEWADWLGAVIGLARSEAGTEVDGRTLVQLINRCPEITTSIPKNDAARIGWAFEQALYAWAVTGVLDDDGALTEAGRWLLPRAALAAWEGQPAG